MSTPGIHVSLLTYCPCFQLFTSIRKIACNIMLIPSINAASEVIPAHVIVINMNLNTVFPMIDNMDNVCKLLSRTYHSVKIYVLSLWLNSIYRIIVHPLTPISVNNYSWYNPSILHYILWLRDWQWEIIGFFVVYAVDVPVDTAMIQFVIPMLCHDFRIVSVTNGSVMSILIWLNAEDICNKSWTDVQGKCFTFVYNFVKQWQQQCFFYDIGFFLNGTEIRWIQWNQGMWSANSLKTFRENSKLLHKNIMFKSIK